MTSNPTRSRARAAGATIALVGTLTLTACSAEDRPALPEITLPSFSLPSGDELKSFVADARSQIEEVSGDVASAATALEGLSGNARGSAEEALGTVQGAVGQVQEALDAAKSGKEDAEEQLAAASTTLQEARAKIDDALASLGTSTDEVTSRARSELTDLRAELDRLEGDVTAP